MTTQIPRPPIIAVMGHIDHGKSSLLDYIRRTHVVDTEAGHITQHVSAYEVSEDANEAIDRSITFLDTPGHAAFFRSRSRGVEIADIAILVIAADDGIQPQTTEALTAIRNAGIPFIVAINKIDKQGANAEKIKQDLLQHELYLEQYSGDVPAVEISATTGQGIDDLLEMIGIVADMEELTADPSGRAQGVILESERDPKRGISATLIITAGTLAKGSYVATANAFAPVRIMEDFQGHPIDEATFSRPIKIVGWNELPDVGAAWDTFPNKKKAEKCTEGNHTAGADVPGSTDATEEQTVIPVLLKADSQAGLDGLEHEIRQCENDRIVIQVLKADIGNITENDTLFAAASNHAIILGFNTSVDASALAIAERDGIPMAVFSVIYEAADWFRQQVTDRTPRRVIKEPTGYARVLREFSNTKTKQVLGGKVKEGELNLHDPVTVYRHENEIGHGTITNLQHQKQNVSRVSQDMEFGTEIDAKIDIQKGDSIEGYTEQEQ